MSGSKLDRQQIRRAIRQMGNEYIFYLPDDAISLLSQDQLRQLIASCANPDQFIEHEAQQKDLLTEVLAFQKASLAGEYYEEPPITAKIGRRTPGGRSAGSPIFAGGSVAVRRSPVRRAPLT